MRVARVVEHLADLDAAIEQLLAGGFDVGDDQVQALGGAGRRRGDVLAEDHRGAGARRRELEDGMRKSSPSTNSASSRQPSWL